MGNQRLRKHPRPAVAGELDLAHECGTAGCAKHCGIVSAPDRFIHAYERSGVVEVPLDAAWRRRVAFVFLFPNPS